MTQTERKKMCWNCEADVNHQATYCPFCGTDLLNYPQNKQPETAKQEMFASQSLQDSLTSLYKPPYSARNREGYGVPDDRRNAQFSEPQPDPLFSTDIRHTEERQLTPSEEKRGSIWSILLLSLGANLLTLGLILFFFADDGKLTLEWNSHAWFIYCLLSLPILFFGWRFLSQPKKTPE